MKNKEEKKSMVYELSAKGNIRYIWLYFKCNKWIKNIIDESD